MNLSWNASPASDSVLNYTVTTFLVVNGSRATQVGTPVTDSSTSVAISGLLSNEDYEFEITATNAVGVSSPTVVSALGPVPPASVWLFFTLSDTGRVRIAWTRP